MGAKSLRGRGAVLKGGQLPIQIKPKPGLEDTKKYLKKLKEKRRK